MFADSNFADPSTISSGLLNDVRNRDGEAWGRFVNLYGPLAYRWCRESGLQPQDAADIVQDVFCAVLTGIGKFQRTKTGGTFRGWLRTITNNKIRDAARRQRRQPHALGPVEPPGSDDAALEQQREEDCGDDDEALGVVSRALTSIRDDFTPRTWHAFYRSAVNGHSASEIAADLGMTAKAVRQAKYRVLLRLREELEPGL